MKSSLPSAITKVTTMADNTLRLVVDCQEMPPESMSELFQLKGRMGWFFFKEKPITELDEKELPEIKLESQNRTPSSRLRSVLYVLWQQKNPQQSFDVFYSEHMEQFINSIKSNLI